MSLSFEEELAFRDLHRRLEDVRRALRRCYIGWHARSYGTVAVAVVGVTLLICGLSMWPLAIAGAILTASSLIVAVRTLRTDRAASSRRPLWRRLLRGRLARP